MDNKCKTITCTSMTMTNSRQYIIVITIIIIPISVVHFPNELNQKPLTVSQLVLQLQTSRAQSQSKSLPCFSNHLLKFSPTKPTAFSDLSQSKLLKFSQNLQSLSLSLKISVSPQFIMNQYALILSKQTLIS